MTDTTVDVRRHRIVHKTSIGYDKRATASYNELRMSPLTEPGQTTLENRLRVRPMTWSHVYRDYWGAHVTAMEAIGDHSSLEVEATSTVERSNTVPLPTGGTWEDLTDPRLLDLQNEYLTLTERTEPGDELVGLARDARGPRSPRDTAYRVVEIVRERMTYETGVTNVHSSAQQAWTEQRGVCQDFAHVTIGALRSLGMPARYVSGYLAPKREAEVGESSKGESHAWVEFWDGGWMPFDPTNGVFVGLDHVVVVRGRDYADVQPFKGVYSGAAESTLTVEVSFTRLR
ncbi:MAG TPA: transglutaminase family protein [Lapillicoccus sp.]|nr:transglutaminase family protein [Lapillicoccus sp.]